MKIESFITHPDMPIRQDLVYNFIYFLCTELNVTPTKISVASYKVDDGILGMCIDEADDNFIILVNEKERSLTEVFVTIAHEMVHVKQYMKEKLGWFLDNRSHIPYHERWWEKEAFGLQYNLVEKFVKTI
jgi:hypothetical protein